MKKLLLIFLILFVVVGCGNSKVDDTVIRVAATAYPHAEFLKELEAPLAEEGYTLEVTVVDDYKIPNTLLDDGNIDANFFQHIPYLEEFNEQTDSDLQWVLKVHYEPIAIYAGSKTDLGSVSDKDTILVPDDATNLPRALLLLEELNWITLSGEKKTLQDIETNPYNLEIKEIEADSIAPLINDADFAIINGNFALAAEITDRGLQAETISQERIDLIANVLVVEKEHENSDKTKALLKAFGEESVKSTIKTKYAPSVISVLD